VASGIGPAALDDFYAPEISSTVIGVASKNWICLTFGRFDVYRLVGQAGMLAKCVRASIRFDFCLFRLLAG
jgi:hypothetical protein